MGVQFHIESIPTGEWTISLYDWETGLDSEVTRFVGDYADARLAVLLASEQSGIEIQDYDVHAVTDVDGTPSVDLGQANAEVLLAHLGLSNNEDDEPVGSEDGEAFLARCLVASVEPSPVREAYVLSGDGHATWHECGADAASFDRRLSALTEMAREAARLGRQVVWS